MLIPNDLGCIPRKGHVCCAICAVVFEQVEKQQSLVVALSIQADPRLPGMRGHFVRDVLTLL